MEIKNIKLSVWIFACLIILSFAFFSLAEKSNTANIFLDSDQDGLADTEEKTYGTDPNNPDTDQDGYSDGTEVKSGYDPKKPSPGDKLITEEPVQTADSATPEKENLTKKVAQKITLLANSFDETDKEITLEDINKITDEISHQTISEEELPEVTDEEIKIKKQNFKGLSEEEIKNKKRADFSDYLVAVFYIIASNSPKPLTSGVDMTKVMMDVAQEVSSNIVSQNIESLEVLAVSGQKIIDQLKEIEVPQDLVSIHKKALRFAKYSLNIPKIISPNPEDPLAEIASFSKVQAFLQVIIDFTDEVEEKFNEYGIKYDEVIKGKIKNLGIIPPEFEEQSVTETENKTITDTDKADKK